MWDDLRRRNSSGDKPRYPSVDLSNRNIELLMNNVTRKCVQYRTFSLKVRLHFLRIIIHFVIGIQPSSPENALSQRSIPRMPYLPLFMIVQYVKIIMCDIYEGVYVEGDSLQRARTFPRCAPSLRDSKHAWNYAPEYEAVCHSVAIFSNHRGASQPVHVGVNISS